MTGCPRPNSYCLPLLVALLVGWPTAATARSWRGVSLPASCETVEPERFRCAARFERVVAFYRKAFRRESAVRLWRAEALPGVRLVHVTNDDPDAWWEGLNISEYEGAVHLFWLAATPPTAAAP